MVVVVPHGAWAMWIGTDAPLFVMYANGVVAHRHERSWQYRCRKLEDPEAEFHKLFPDREFFELEEFYALNQGTDQDMLDVFAATPDGYHRVSVYAWQSFKRTGPSVLRFKDRHGRIHELGRTVAPPDAFARTVHEVQSLEVDGTPCDIGSVEIMAVPASPPRTGAPVPWPDSWPAPPGLDADGKRRRFRRPANEHRRVIELLPHRLDYRGTIWALYARRVLPGEDLWLSRTYE